MKTKIYLDTSVISALFDARTPERMALTQDAWDLLQDYAVYISDIVIDEINHASPHLREKMLVAISDITVLQITETEKMLAECYVEKGIFPYKYIDDALHVAVASTHQIGILLSWNFAHLVKLKTRRLVALANSLENYMPVEIISPPEL